MMFDYRSGGPGACQPGTGEGRHGGRPAPQGPNDRDRRIPLRRVTFASARVLSAWTNREFPMQFRFRAAVALLTRLGTVALAVAAFAANAQDAARYPLMAVEQHRASVVKAIVDRWSAAFAVLPGSEQRTA